MHENVETRGRSSNVMRIMLYTLLAAYLAEGAVSYILPDSSASTLPGSTTGSTLNIPDLATTLPSANATAPSKKATPPPQSPNSAQDSISVTNLPDYNANTNNPLYHENISDAWGPYYNQHDSRWNNAYLGTSKNVTIGSEGCLVADLAMVWSHLTHKTHTPLDVNAHKNWFGDNQISIKDPLPTLDGHKPIENTHASLDVMHQQVKDGYTLIVELKWDKPEGGAAYHYVVVTGLDSNGHFLINDPWYGDNMHVPFGNHWGNNNLTGREWAYK